MALFALCVSGYEEYCPIWFRAECTVSYFQQSSKKVIARAVRKLIRKKDYGYIGGHDILDTVVPMMEQIGFIVVKPEMEIDLRGECLYSNRKDDKPDIIDNETWKLIIKNNARVHKELHRRMREDQKSTKKYTKYRKDSVKKNKQ